MIKNYFKIALRSFKRHKLFTLINTIGLSIGITAALVIYLIVHFDFTFDKYHKDSDSVYRVVSDFTFQGDKSYNPGVCGPLNQYASQVTGIKTLVPVYSISADVFVPGKGNAPVKFKSQERIALVANDYFNLFSYKWMAGSSKNALIEPNVAVLTSEQAKKYFPGFSYAQMIGKTVIYDTLKIAINGIVETPVANTDLTFQEFISFSTGTSLANKALNDRLQLKEWRGTNSASQLFVKLSATASPKRVEKQLTDLLNKNSPQKPSENSGGTNFKLQPLNDLHYNADYGIFDFSERTANRHTLYYLIGIASFLLLLGCINFINLTTAQSSQRAKEIGIRKTLGSNRRGLIFQFLSETFLITFIAVLISIALTPLMLKTFADFIPKGVKADFLQLNIILFLLGLILVVGFASGFYPAMLLSGYKPVAVLKNQTSSNSSQTRNAWLRKSLTVTQFIIAQFFIMATTLVGKQIYYALHKDLGFKKDAIIIITSPWKNFTPSRNASFLNDLRALPQVEAISLGNSAPSSTNTSSSVITYKDGKKEIKTEVEFKSGDENYLKIYGIKLVAGRALQKSDTTKAMLINETYANKLGFKDPAKAVGKFLNYGKQPTGIAGVMHDFYQKSLRTAIKPLAFNITTSGFQNHIFHIALKPQTPGGNEWKTALASMETSWKKIYPDDDFEYHFFDDNIAKFYQSEQHTSTLLSWATGASIFISCLGLLGLAIYTTNQRTKEIGVRKVLGASVTQIVTLLSTEMVLLILLAFAIATPLAWWAMHQWMQNFAERTSISWWIFILSGIIMLAAALFTSGLQTVKAAIANPVKSLRSE